jgi:hypothetical protein
VLPRPDHGPRLERLEPRLLPQLPAQRLGGVLAGVEPAAGSQPDVDAVILVHPVDEEHAVVGVEHERARGDADLVHPAGKWPAKTTLPSSSGISARLVSAARAGSDSAT